MNSLHSYFRRDSNRLFTGRRPLPSCLGGGDQAAGYEAAIRRELSRHSTIDDVADFVVDYIISDVSFKVYNYLSGLSRLIHDLQNLGIIAKRWLVIADQSGIFDKDCLALAQLHSDAVDYPKTGTPVPMQTIPKDPGGLPDWSQPEIILNGPGVQYYPSKTALGVLYRDIHLYDPISHRRRRGGRNRGKRHWHEEEGDDGDELPAQLPVGSLSMDEGTVYEAVISRTRALGLGQPSDDRYKSLAEDIFVTFASQLEHICASHTLSNKYERLSEVEAILGVISERTSQTRRRKELMAKLREYTAQLVTDIRWEFQMGEGEHSDPRNRLALALTAWEFSRKRILAKEFGARSFWWICLGAIFEAIRIIEDEDEAS